MKWKSHLVALSLAIPALSHSPVFAADSSTVGGAACYPRRPSQGSYVTLGLMGTGNVVGSNSNPIVDVVCPLKRDNLANASTGIITTQVRVFRGPQSPATPLVCTLSSRNAIGALVSNASHTQQSLASGETTLTLSVQSSLPGGYYIVNCSLPWDNAVRSLRLDEP